MRYDGQERRTSITLSEEDMDKFIDHALDRASDRFFAEVGKSVVKKLLWIVGVMVVGLFALGKNKGWF